MNISKATLTVQASNHNHSIFIFTPVNNSSYINQKVKGKDLALYLCLWVPKPTVELEDLWAIVCHHQASVQHS